MLHTQQKHIEFAVAKNFLRSFDFSHFHYFRFSCFHYNSLTICYSLYDAQKSKREHIKKSHNESSTAYTGVFGRIFRVFEANMNIKINRNKTRVRDIADRKGRNIFCLNKSMYTIGNIFE